MNINVNITNKHCAVQGAPVIVCGNSDYTMTFTFDAEWDNAGEKTARFSYIRDGVRRYQDVQLEGNTVAVPPVYGTKGLQVGVYSGDLVTSTPGRIPCEKSIVCGTVDPEDMYPGPAKELRDELGQLMGVVEMMGGIMFPEVQVKKATLVQYVPYGSVFVHVYNTHMAENEGAILTICGKNLYDAKTYPLNTDGYPYKTLGHFSTSANYKRTGFIPVAHLRGQTITLNYAPSATNPGMAFYSYLPDAANADDCKTAFCGGGSGANIVVPTNANYMCFCVDAKDAGKDIQIEIGSVSTTYETYCSEDISVNFDGDYSSVGCRPVSTGMNTICATSVFWDEDGALHTRYGEMLPLDVTGTIDVNGTIAALVDKINSLTASCLIAAGSAAPAADGGATE